MDRVTGYKEKDKLQVMGGGGNVTRDGRKLLKEERKFCDY